MPLYHFQCGEASCSESFTEMRGISVRDDPTRCPQCGGAARRQLVPPQLALVSTAMRNAHDTNERSSHQPSSTRRGGHAPGCGCCSGAGATPSGPPGRPKGFPGKRPWMISH
ncbi:FmdB family zinc ribbon protein [Panacagrimonas sp.]|uniref:FmdB family zinc ribbon protein n=1 Tax=Panacagrimonas sp. TaxID=2480088 RepID=UPI003B52ED0D